MSGFATISGKNREIVDGYVTISGKWRKITDGWAVKNGVWQQIYSSGGAIPITDLPVGSVIKAGMGGVGVNFIIVNHGIPSNSSLYDSSCNGTWILIKDVRHTYTYSSLGSAAYVDNAVYPYVNDTVYNTFDAGVKSLIKTVKIPYVSSYSNKTIGSGSSGLSVKCFLLSAQEYNVLASTYPFVDGAPVSYFANTVVANADTKRIAYYNGAATSYNTRTAWSGDSGALTRITETGSRGKQASMPNMTVYLRIACVLNSNATVFSVPNADGSYTLLT